jgi:hypothetical protein
MLFYLGKSGTFKANTITSISAGARSKEESQDLK